MGGSSASPSIFGLAGYLNVSYTTLALVGAVGITVFFELVTHTLEHRLQGTPFLGMLSRVYKGERPQRTSKLQSQAAQNSLLY